ncbi:MAG: CRTAC1 family protein [Thermoanaerobaculia bacterium]
MLSRQSLLPRPGVRCFLLLAVLAAAACRGREGGPFRDTTRASGVDFSYRSDMVEAKLVANVGGGSALADYDNDGKLDLFLVNSVRKYKAASNAGNCGKLFRGRGDGTFEDVTAASGIRQCGWGFGVWWVDLDNDGWLDLYITNLGSNELWHNNGNGTFTRMPAGRFPDDRRYSIPAAFLDANRDGRLDVFIGNYVVTSLEEESKRTLSHQKLPDEYDPPGACFFLQRSDGTFADVTQAAGLGSVRGRTMGAIAFDYNGDGMTDLYLADDQSPNYLYRGRGDGTFEDVSAETGTDAPPEGPTAFGRRFRSGMGLAVADYDGDGRPDLFITNFANEPNTLYRSVEGQLFEETDRRAGLAAPSIPYSAWGCNFFDYDNDGWPDLFVSNGQILPRWLYWYLRAFSKKAANYNIGERTYRQPQHLFHNRGDGTFERVPQEKMGDLGKILRAGRGTAAGDLDGDGRLDLVLAPITDPVMMFRNEASDPGHWIEILPVGAGDGRTPLHAKVTVGFAGRRSVQEFTIQPSFASGSYLPLHFGLGRATRIDAIEVVWPEGAVQKLSVPAVGHAYRVSRRAGLTEGLEGLK